MKYTTLVVMAAGLGSRFTGGLKQLAKLGKNGETLIELSIKNAMEAGFNKVVFVIRKEIEEDFKCIIGNNVEGMDIVYVYQDILNIPSGFKFENRIKPWGTGHAILVTKDVVKEPFCTINADDYYGLNSFKKMYNFLTTSINEYEYSLVGYKVINTLSKIGTVSRGICSSTNGNLNSIKETHGIKLENNLIISDNNILDKNAIASVNIWGFKPTIYDELEIEFNQFLNNISNIEKDEFFLPSVVNNMINSNKAIVKILETDDKWYGITYKEDVDVIKEELLKV